jgi:hypothetical protein
MPKGFGKIRKKLKQQDIALARKGTRKSANPTKEGTVMDMRTILSKRKVCTLFIAVVFVIVCSALPVEVKAAKKLTTKSKTLSVAQEYTLTLKGLSKKDKKSSKRISWKLSDKTVAVFKGKTKYGVTLKARNIGFVTVTGTYQEKKYTCKIRVKEVSDKNNSDNVNSDTTKDIKSQDKNVKLNASETTLYYLEENDRQYITPAVGHQTSFQFKVSGQTKGESIRWSIQSSKNVTAFTVNDDGKVSLWCEPAELDNYESATLVAKLEDGTKLTATLQGYSERGIAVKNKMKEFQANYITDGMTEYQKMETIAKYVESEYDYVYSQSDWEEMVISGGGNCYASRYLVKYLCEEEGIKALACNETSYHGKTLVKADGKMYIVVTGFDEPKPRRYMIMELTEQTLQNVAADNGIDLLYFD